MTRMFLKLILPGLSSIAEKKKSLKGIIPGVTLPCLFPIFQLPRGMQYGHHQFHADWFPGAFNLIYIQFPHYFLQFLIGWFSEVTNVSSEIADVPSAYGGDNLKQLIIFIEIWPQDLTKYEGLYHPDSAGQHRGRIRWWLHNAEVSAQVHRAALWNTFHLSHESKLLVWN